MKTDTPDKSIKAAWALVRELERLLAVIKVKRDEPAQLWRERRAEMARLQAADSADTFDPLAPDADQKLAAHSLRQERIVMLNKILASDPRDYRDSPPAYGAEGEALFESVVKLQKLIWDMAEPIELTYWNMCRCGLVGLDPTNYSTATAAKRLLSFARNWGQEAAAMLCALARKVLTQKLPPLPATFGMTPRDLTKEEQTFLDSRAVAAPAHV